VVIGKGITFDSGGISIKPADKMWDMKFDKMGACAILGVMSSIARLELPLHVVGLMPSAENMPSGKATKPGDVLTAITGKTIEVQNTDAEGRLILADAIGYADRFKPAAVIDMATLTGAARVALGPDLPAMFTDDDDLAASVLRHASHRSDPLWRLPLHEPYREGLKSPVADLNNVSDGPMAGAVTAALYLKSFVERATSWLHLDMYAWNDRLRPGRPRGGEAQTIRALFDVIAERHGG